MSAGNGKSIGGFRIQFQLGDNKECTQYNIPKKDHCRNSSTDWTVVSLNFKCETKWN